LTLPARDVDPNGKNAYESDIETGALEDRKRTLTHDKDTSDYDHRKPACIIGGRKHIDAVAAYLVGVLPTSKLTSSRHLSSETSPTFAAPYH